MTCNAGRLVFLCAFGMLAFVEPATCQQPTKGDIYVATSGNDKWSGTLAAPNAARTDGPIATLEQARRAAQRLKRSGRNAPIKVVVREGTYFLNEPLKLGHDDSGSADSPVIYAAYPGEKPVISGGRPITDWKVSGGRWTANVDGYTYFEQLFVNGQRRYRPRSTDKYLRNEGSVYADSQSDVCRVFVPRVGAYQCFDRFRFKAGDLQSNYANITDVEINDFEKWQMSKMRLKSVDTSAGIAYLTGPTFPNPNSGFIAGHRYLVENVKEALNDPGEWYLDRPTSQLTYIPRPGETPARAAVIAPQLAQLIIADDLSYVTFKGLTFSHDNWVVPPQGHQSLQSEPNVSAALSFRNSDHITFDSCTISHTGGWGVEFVSGDNGPSHHNLVENSVLFDLGTGGIRIGAYHKRDDTEDNVPHDNVIQNNLIASGGRILPAGIGTGVWIGNSPRNTITHNEIYDFYGGGIGVCVPTPAGCPFPHDNTVSFNHVYQQGQGIVSDFAGIYLATYKTSGNRVINNRVHDVTHAHKDPDGYNGIGIYLDNITSNVRVANNVVYRASQSVIFNNRGANNIWTNNILAYGRDGIVQLGGLDVFSRRRMMQQQRQRPGGPGGQQGGPGGQGGPGQGPFGRRGQRRRPGPPPGGPQGRPQGGPEAGPQEQADPDKPALIFTHNIVIWDRGMIQKVPGFWLCAHPVSEGSVPCPTRFQFDSNLYWNPQSKEPIFATSEVDNPREARQLSMNDWRSLGEDQHSIVADPRLANPKHPADDFRLLPGSPAAKIGFQPFDQGEAGLTTPLPRPPAQPPAFPLEPLNPEDY